MIRRLATLAILALTLCLPLAAQPKLGPQTGFRVLAWDYACMCVRLLKLDPEGFRVVPDPAGEAIGVWEAVPLAAPGTNPAQIVELPAYHHEELNPRACAWTLSQDPIPGTVELFVGGFARSRTTYIVTGRAIALTTPVCWNDIPTWVTYWTVK